MAKKSKVTEPKKILPHIDYTAANLYIFLAGVLLLVIGYWLMTQGPYDNPLSTTVAPMLLLFTYIVVFPLALLWGSKKHNEKDTKDN